MAYGKSLELKEIKREKVQIWDSRKLGTYLKKKHGSVGSKRKREQELLTKEIENKALCIEA